MSERHPAPPLAASAPSARQPATLPALPCPARSSSMTLRACASASRCSTTFSASRWARCATGARCTPPTAARTRPRPWCTAPLSPGPPTRVGGRRLLCCLPCVLCQLAAWLRCRGARLVSRCLACCLRLSPPDETHAPRACTHNRTDWSLGLPAGEEAECVAAGSSFCAVATSRRTLRVFTPGGLQARGHLEPPPWAHK